MQESTIDMLHFLGLAYKRQFAFDYHSMGNMHAYIQITLTHYDNIITRPTVRNMTMYSHYSIMPRISRLRHIS